MDQENQFYDLLAAPPLIDNKSKITKNIKYDWNAQAESHAGKHVQIQRVLL